MEILLSYFIFPGSSFKVLHLWLPLTIIIVTNKAASQLLSKVRWKLIKHIKNNRPARWLCHDLTQCLAIITLSDLFYSNRLLCK